MGRVIAPAVANTVAQPALATTVLAPAVPATSTSSAPAAVVLVAPAGSSRVAPHKTFLVIW